MAKAATEARLEFKRSIIFPLIGSGAPTDGTSGTGVGRAGPCSIYLDYTNKVLYMNTGTKASPVWTAGASLAGAVTGTTATFSGALSATTGTFSGAIAGTSITGTGALIATTGTFSGAVQTTGATVTSGYKTGAGGAVTQITNASTGVTLSKPCGKITTVALTTAGAAEERFTVTNTLVTATDTIALGTTYDGGGTPIVSVLKVAAGAFDIVISNLSASSLDAVMVINFAVLKSVAA